MVILDKPYVSEHLIDTIRNNGFYVLDNAFSRQFESKLGNLLLSELEFISKAQTADNLKIYSNSENAIGWVSKHLPNHSITQNIKRFKDKAQFRRLIAPLFPDFFFKEVKIDEIDDISTESLSFPLIIKPATGFFSLGVYKVNRKEDWTKVKQRIVSEMESMRNIYPEEVLDLNTFIIEASIEGDEFAFDAYYDENGKPAILGIFKHHFGSAEDVNDRVYYTSKKIIENYHTPFLSFLKELGTLAEIKNFPLHVEVRISENGTLMPIEANPFRFGGWCTTADAIYFAFGINPYVYYLKSLKPNWEAILSDYSDSLFSIIVLDNTTGTSSSLIKSFNFNAMCSKFSKVLELRKVDYKTYHVFGFIFTETPHDNFFELNNIATSSLKEFISV